MDYATFLDSKRQIGGASGFAPLWMPDFLFDFQSHLVEWSLRKGKSAIFADCGLGKTPMQLAWAENVVRHTNRPVLILTPLAVTNQTVKEAAKFHIDAVRWTGRLTSRARIHVTNYEKLHLLDAADYAGVVCDESSILKHFGGATQKHVTRFLSKLQYRLLCTATAAPNDYHELGTSSEAIGSLGYSDMLSRFFKMDDKKRHRMNDVKLSREMKTGRHYAKLAYRVSQQIGQWRLKGHAEEPFWRWVCSWAMACRNPSDLGFSDARFVLPELVERDHLIEPTKPADGMLFQLPAIGLQQERDERRRTMRERCDLVATLADHLKPVVVWCHLNTEGDELTRTIPGAKQIAGKTADEEKEELYEAFGAGQLRCLVIKPKIGAWGLNWQHCAHVITFASHSYEQYYQAIRRCYRFGQSQPVIVDVIATTGEGPVLDNMRRKSAAADLMFSRLVAQMHQSQIIERDYGSHALEIPSWLYSTVS